MILDDIQEIIDNAKCPDSFPSDLNIGYCPMKDNDSQKLFEFFPSDTCDAFSSIKQYQDMAYVAIHTHGIEVKIDGIRVYIHNSQIILFDYWHFDDTVKYKRSDSRASRIGMGALLAGGGIPGAIVGGAIGLATSFGTGKKHLKRDILVIAYWDVQTRTQQIIELQERKDSEKDSVKALIDYWKLHVQANEKTGRKAAGDFNSGVTTGNSGCLLLLTIGITPVIIGMGKILGLI